jgi:hypothetical protein
MWISSALPNVSSKSFATSFSALVEVPQCDIDRKIASNAVDPSECLKDD